MIPLIFLFSPLFLFGEQIYYELDTIYVTASRYKIDIFHTPFGVEILPEGETSLTERLLKISGISILDYGNLTTIAVKGPNNKSTTVALNDIPLNSPQSGDFDISLIPSYFIGEGYITNTSLAGLQLSGNLGNTASFYTKDKEEGIIIKKGSFGRFGAGGILSLFSTTGGFYLEDNKNRYPFRDEFNNLHYRENAQYRHWAGYLTSNAPAKINLFWTLRNADIPEKLGSVAGLPHKDEGLLAGSFFYDTRALRIGSYGNFYCLDYKDTIFGNDRHKSLSGGLDFSFKSENRELGFFLKKESASSTKIGEHSRINAGIDFSQRLKVKFFSSLPSVKIAVTNERLFSFSIFLPFLYFLRENLGTYHNLAFGYRYPTLNELYWPEDNFSEGNPDLKNETEITVETGVRYVSSYFLKLGAFLKFGEDIIIWMPGNDGKWRPYNSPKFRAWGLDWSSSLESPLNISFGYSLFSGQIDGSVIPYRPEHNINLNIEKLGFFSEVLFLLKRPANPSGLSFLKDVYFINFGYHFTRKIANLSWAIDSRIKNILDKNYQFVEGYPQPGRHYEITLKINW